MDGANSKKSLTKYYIVLHNNRYDDPYGNQHLRNEIYTFATMWKCCLTKSLVSVITYICVYMCVCMYVSNQPGGLAN